MAKILLIEDDELNRDMLSRRLRKRGYEVIGAADGEEGLRLAQAEKPALILMDVSLPGIDGWEATRRLKADPATHPIPVLILTGYATAADRERAIAVDCSDFDVKPIDFARLLSKMESLLGAGARA